MFDLGTFTIFYLNEVLIKLIYANYHIYQPVLVPEWFQKNILRGGGVFPVLSSLFFNILIMYTYNFLEFMSIYKNSLKLTKMFTQNVIMIS